MRRLVSSLAGIAALALASAAAAAPLPYCTSQLDTMQALINGCAIAQVNSNLPDAAVNQVATGSAGAATLNGLRGTVTTESLSTAAGSVYTETLTNSSVTAASQVFVTVGNGTNSAGSPALTTVVPGAGSVVIKIQNIHASAAFNGTLTVGFRVVN